MSENINEWLEFYRKASNERQFFAEKAWETIKFHIVLASSLISITVGALSLMLTSEVFLILPKIIKSLLTILVVILPITMLYVVGMGSRNFNRECKRMYEQISIIMKIEERLDLTQQRIKPKQFPRDTTYFPQRYDEKWDNSCQFINTMMRRKDTLYGIMRGIFTLFKSVSWTLIAIIILFAIMQ